MSDTPLPMSPEDDVPCSVPAQALNFDAGTGLSLGQKLAWLVLALGIVGLIGGAFYKKMHPPEPRLGQSQSQIESPGDSVKRYTGGAVRAGSDAPKPEDLAVWGAVKTFSLVDQSGAAISAQDLRGEVWVANFIFTRCAGTCPQMTRAMADLNRELADLPQVKLVSFTMDPEFDTPEVLSKYAFTHDAVSPRWKFLTGGKTEMHRMTRDEFQLVVKPNDPSVPEEPIIHSSKFILLDREGKIRGRFDGLSQDGPNLESMKTLAAAVRKLRAESVKETKQP